jgi:hypothetical protein
MRMRACAICKTVLFKFHLAKRCGASVDGNGVARDQEQGGPNPSTSLPDTPLIKLPRAELKLQLISPVAQSFLLRQNSNKVHDEPDCRASHPSFTVSW